MDIFDWTTKEQPILLSDEDYHKLNQYNEVNLRYLKKDGDLADIPLYDGSITNISKGTELSKPLYIYLGTKIQDNTGKFRIVGGRLIFSVKKQAWLSEIVEELKNNVYRGTDIFIPVFDKNGKLIVKIVI